MIGTNYIQDIRVTKELCQIKIRCNFLVNNSLVLGYLAVVHSDNNDVRYLITENFNQGMTNSTLYDLNVGQYSILLYAINGSGLPSKQAAWFPLKVSISATKHKQG